jgi:hypothetical protein
MQDADNGATRFVAIAAMLAAGANARERRTAPRRVPREEADAQRSRTPTTPRSSVARREFQRLHACPSTGRRLPYVVDHIIALKRGGLDAPSNLQWQTIAEAKDKDRVEWLCRFSNRLPLE